MKQMLTNVKIVKNSFISEDRGGVEEEERRKRMQVVEKFQTAPFEEIAAHCGARVRGLFYSNQTAQKPLCGLLAPQSFFASLNVNRDQCQIMSDVGNYLMTTIQLWTVWLRCFQCLHQ